MSHIKIHCFFITQLFSGSEYEQPIKELQASYDKLLAKVKAHQEISQKNGRELNLLSVAHGKRKDIEEDMEKIVSIAFSCF